MGAVYAEKLGVIKEGAGLSRQDVAKVVGATPRTVFRWATGEISPRGPLRDRLLELAAVSQRLSKVMKPQAATAWLFTPNPLLRNRRPSDLISEGEYQEVLNAIDAIAEGVFV